MHNDPEVKIIVLLGEVGGVEEYKIAEAVKSGKLTKPIVAWCIGTCADMFISDVQFGHAGSRIQGCLETSQAKNEALRNSGVHVPESFEDLPHTIQAVYSALVDVGIIDIFEEPPVPQLPIDFAWAHELGMIRKPSNFMTS
eukprot:UC4_evm1s778